MSSPRWIEDAAGLAAAARRWRAAGLVAFDTEFVFERTFRPRLGLVQIATPDEIALVDPLGARDLAPIAELLADEEVRVVAHAVAGDLVALEPWLERGVRALFDTQVGGALAGLGASLSYAAIVRELEGVELAKHETRTDWLRRPLSADQIRYAQEDVAHLPEIERKLRQRLESLGRLAWAEAASAEVAAAALERLPPDAAWRRLRGIERLPPRARRIARSLAEWREREAERRDLARPFLLRDPTLLALARRGTIDPSKLEKLPGYDRRRHERHIEAWTAALAEASAAADGASAPSDDLEPRAPDELERRIDSRLAEIAESRATELSIPVEMLLAKRERKRAAAAIRAGTTPSAAIGGWRAEALGPMALDALDAGD